MESFQNPDDDAIRRLLERVRRIAVVGLPTARAAVGSP